MTSGLGPAAPVPDLDSGPWWAHLRDHVLALQRCADCSAWRWPPRPLCGRCGSPQATWERCSGLGTIASWIVTHHDFGLGPDVPYLVVTVRLAEQDDLLLIGSMSEGSSEPRIGQVVRARFDERDDPGGTGTFTLLLWEAEAAS